MFLVITKKHQLTDKFTIPSMASHDFTSTFLAQTKASTFSLQNISHTL